MEPSEQPPSVRVGQQPDGSYTYLVDRAPDLLPAVRGRDLERAWDAARQAALAADWGVPRHFRFHREDGAVTDLALSDSDARCWAGAVDRTAGMRTCYGLSVFLRLLALVDLLAKARWAVDLVKLARDGAELHPMLLRAAATAVLTGDARFDADDFRERLGPLGASLLLNPPASAVQLAGVRP